MHLNGKVSQAGSTMTEHGGHDDLQCTPIKLKLGRIFCNRCGSKDFARCAPRRTAEGAGIAVLMR